MRYSARPPKKCWSLYIRIFQFAVTLVLMGILVKSVQWSTFLPVLAHLKWHFIGLAGAVLLSCHLINVMRWQYLLNDHSISYTRLLIFYSAGFFSNNFLPTGVGGDGVRAILLSREVPWSRSVLSVGLDRMIGLLSLPFFMIPALWLGIPPVFTDVQHVIVRHSSLQTLVLLFICILFVSITLIAFIKYKVTPVYSWLQRLLDRLILFKDRRTYTSGSLLRLFGGAYGFSVLSNFGLILAHWLVLQAFTINVSFGAAIWLVLIGSISLLVPIAINGLGVMESVFIAVLAGYDVSAIVALGVALIIRMFMLFYSLVGGILSLHVGAGSDFPVIPEHSNLL